jgi:hypothetical protein
MSSPAFTVKNNGEASPGNGGAFSHKSFTSPVKSKRLRERVKLMIPARVRGRTSVSQGWNEMTRLIDVTPFGARFTLSHIVEPGHLLHLLLPMPRVLRCFDYAEEQYRVWSIIRNIKFLPAQADGTSCLEVGVAFIGKHPPASYASAPETRYDITLSEEASCKWVVSERPQPPPSKRADDTRLNLPIEVRVELLDEKGAVAEIDETVTENISRRGAAVFTRLNAERGSFCLVTDVRSGLRVLGVVRACRTGADNIPRLHLEFLDHQWPLDGLT